MRKTTICPSCRTSPKEFGLNYCRTCHNEKSRLWGRQNSLHKSSRERERRTGFSKEQVEKLLVSQDYKCAICQASITGGADTNADHDHSTGQPRGLLCIKCNVGLGIFRDNPDLLRVAASYLESYMVEDSKQPKKTFDELLMEWYKKNKKFVDFERARLFS